MTYLKQILRGFMPTPAEDKAREDKAREERIAALKAENEKLKTESDRLAKKQQAEMKKLEDAFNKKSSNPTSNSYSEEDDCDYPSETDSSLAFEDLI